MSDTIDTDTRMVLTEAVWIFGKANVGMISYGTNVKLSQQQHISYKVPPISSTFSTFLFWRARGEELQLDYLSIATSIVNLILLGVLKDD